MTEEEKLFKDLQRIEDEMQDAWDDATLRALEGFKKTDAEKE